MTEQTYTRAGAAHGEPVQFATYKDLRTRWPDMPVNSEDRVEVLLQDASQFILDTVPTARSAKPATLKRITCAVVRRFMESELSDNRGVNQYTQSAGPYSESFGVHNPDGGFYLRADEKHALGRGKQRAGNVDLLGGLND